MILRGVGVNDIVMKVAIFHSPTDSTLALELADILTAMGLMANPVEVPSDWEAYEAVRLADRLAGLSHYLVPWTEESAMGSWTPFLRGYSLGRGYPLVMWVSTASPEVPSYLNDIPLIATSEALKEHYTIESRRYRDELRRSQARAAIVEQGLALSEQAMAEMVSEGNVAATELYLDAGFPATVRDKHGVALLSLAVRNKHRRAMELLITAGAEINLQAEDRGNTPLMDAVAGGDKDIAAFLLDKGALTDLQSRDGQTALVIAVGRSDAVMVGLLLKAGADPGVCDKLGLSAIKYAKLFNKPEVLSLFEAAGFAPK